MAASDVVFAIGGSWSETAHLRCGTNVYNILRGTGQRKAVLRRLSPASAKRTLPGMLFMVIESFRNGDPGPAGERFQRHGRMLPDGVLYQTSWLEPDGKRCFQVMEAPSLELVKVWIDRWSDLVDFEVVQVVTSAEFWASRQ